MSIIINESLSIGGKTEMPESCMDCKLQDRCPHIPRWAEQDMLENMYLERMPSCPLILREEQEHGDNKTD